MSRFSLIIPTLNEENNIEALLQAIDNHCQQEGLQPEILFIDDGSTDATRSRILSYTGPLTVRLICRDNEKGLASAVMAGARLASSEYLMVMDADLSHPPERISSLLTPLIAATHDMVIGSRYTTGGRTPGWPITRRIGSMIASLPARLLTGVHDPLGGFFAIHRKFLLEITDDVPGFKIALELLARGREKLRVREVPIIFSDRQQGASKMSRGVLYDYLSQLAGLYGLKSPFASVSLLAVALWLGFITLLDTALFGWLTKIELTTGNRQLLSFLVSSTLLLTTGFLLKKGRKAIAGWCDIPFQWLAALVGVVFILRAGLLAQAFLPEPLIFLLTNGLLAILLLSLSFTLLARLRPDVRKHLMIISGLCALLLIKFLYLGSLELLVEETYYWNYAKHPSIGYLDHPPMIALLIGLGTFLFGDNEFGVRLLPFFCWFVTAYFSFAFARLLLDKTSALGSLLLVAVLPIYFSVGIFATPDAPLFACWSATIFFLYKALVHEEKQAWLRLGLALGFGLCSKYSIVFLGPAIVSFMIIDSRARKWFLRPQPYLAAGLALLIFSPVLFWNYQHGWASFLFQSQHRLEDVRQFSLDTLLASIFLLLTPPGALAAFACLSKLAAANLLGKNAFLQDRRTDFFCLLITLIPLAVVLLFSLSKEVKMNWTGPIWLSLLPLIAHKLLHSGAPRQNLLARLWPATLLVTLICYGVLFYQATLGLPLGKHIPSVYPVGWRQLADQINQQVGRIAEKTGSRVVVVATDKYQTASALAFYRQKSSFFQDSRCLSETTGHHLFGYPALMYGFWHSPKNFTNASLLVVSKDDHLLIPDFYQKTYRKLGNISTLVVQQEGRMDNVFYSRVLFGYQPREELINSGREVK